MTDMYNTPEEEIVRNLLSNQYDLTQLDLRFLMRCFVVVYVQVWAFEHMDAGENLTGDVAYSNGDTFHGNDGDYLDAANLAKQLHPISEQLRGELHSRCCPDEYTRLFEAGVREYATEHNVC